MNEILNWVSYRKKWINIFRWLTSENIGKENLIYSFRKIEVTKRDFFRKHIAVKIKVIFNIKYNKYDRNRT